MYKTYDSICIYLHIKIKKATIKTIYIYTHTN